MRLLQIFLIIIFLFNLNSLKADEIQIENKIAKNLRCLICQGQSVYDSDSEFALSLKLLISNKIDEGMTDEQIYDFFKRRYGEWILYDPVLSRNTYFLWLLPILIFFAGGVIIVRKFYIKKQS